MKPPSSFLTSLRHMLIQAMPLVLDEFAASESKECTAVLLGSTETATLTTPRERRRRWRTRGQDGCYNEGELGDSRAPWGLLGRAGSVPGCLAGYSKLSRLLVSLPPHHCRGNVARGLISPLVRRPSPCLPSTFVGGEEDGPGPTQVSSHLGNDSTAS